MSKVILFVRVSTLQQHLESQEDALRRAAIADGYSESDFIVIGKKESAIKLDEEEREGLNELKEYIAKGDITCIYIFELSRLSRRPAILYSIRDQLLHARVQLRCLNPQFTLLTEDREHFNSIANLVFSLFGAMAEQEMIEKKERFHRGRRRLAEEGRYNGGNIPFGYRIDPERNKLIVIDEEEAAIVKEVFNLYESGISQPQLAKEFHRRGNKKLTISFINNILNNKRYTGDKHCYPGSSFDRSYPVIITPEQFDRCREIAKKNNTTADKTKNIYYANKLIVCTKCGCFWSASGSKVSYHCYDAFNVMRKYDHYQTPQCDSRLSISINIMDSLLWYISREAEVNYILCSAAEDKDTYERELKLLYLKLAAIDDRLADIDSKRARIVDSFIDGYISKEKRDERLSEIEKQRKEVLLDQATFQNQIEHYSALINELSNNYGFDDINAIVDQLESNMVLRERIYGITNDEERSRIVHKHIKKVTVSNSEIEYEFGIGKKMARTKFIMVEQYNNVIRYFQFIINTGKKGIILEANENGDPIEKLSVEYLERYIDEGKRRRHREERDANIKQRREKYPADKFIIGYRELAKFLNVGISTAHRWVNIVGLLKPAVIDYFKKEIVVDKAICMKILKDEATKNKWIKKMLEGMCL